MYEKELQRILTASQNNALTFFCWRRRIGTLRSTNLEERYEKRLEQEKPVLDALLSWANEMQAKTAPKSALGRAIGLLLSSILQAKHTGRRRGKLFTKSNEEAWQNRSDTTKAATPSAANRKADERISRPAIRKAADPLLLRCICITVPFSVRNPRQLPLGHRPR